MIDLIERDIIIKGSDWSEIVGDPERYHVLVPFQNMRKKYNARIELAKMISYAENKFFEAITESDKNISCTTLTDHILIRVKNIIQLYKERNEPIPDLHLRITMIDPEVEINERIVRDDFVPPPPPSF